MLEVKADPLEQSFEAFQDNDDGVAALKAELDQLKAKIASGVIAAQSLRPVQTIDHNFIRAAVKWLVTSPNECPATDRFKFLGNEIALLCPTEV